MQRTFKKVKTLDLNQSKKELHTRFTVTHLRRELKKETQWKC